MYLARLSFAARLKRIHDWQRAAAAHPLRVWVVGLGDDPAPDDIQKDDVVLYVVYAPELEESA